MNIDAATAGIIGVAIGSGLQILGNIAGQYFTGRREEIKWNREQVDRRRTEENEKEQARSQLRYETYRISISRLSQVVAAYSNQARVANEDKSQLIQESLESLAMLALLRGDLYSNASESFHSRLHMFAAYPQQDLAKELLEMVNDMAMKDPAIANGASVEEQPQPTFRRFHIDVDPKYRRQLMIEKGKELDQNNFRECDLLDLSPSQRQKLWDANSAATLHGRVINFPMPMIDGQGNVMLKGSFWSAKLDPTIASTKEIFDAWEQEYDTALAAAHAQVKHEGS